MLRTNLSTRPFYNERAVRAVIGTALALVIGLTLFNLVQIAVLTRRQTSLGREAAAAELRASELRSHAAQTRGAVDTKQLESISSAAREANLIIGQRLFSWTALLTQLETTLPERVRITSLRPEVERTGGITVHMTVVGNSIEDIEQFMANLDATPEFSDIVPLEDAEEESGGVRASLEGTYAPSR